MLIGALLIAFADIILVVAITKTDIVLNKEFCFSEENAWRKTTTLFDGQQKLVVPICNYIERNTVIAFGVYFAVHIVVVVLVVVGSFYRNIRGKTEIENFLLEGRICSTLMWLSLSGPLCVFLVDVYSFDVVETITIMVFFVLNVTFRGIPGTVHGHPDAVTVMTRNLKSGDVKQAKESLRVALRGIYGYIAFCVMAFCAMLPILRTRWDLGPYADNFGMRKLVFLVVIDTMGWIFHRWSFFDVWKDELSRLNDDDDDHHHQCNLLGNSIAGRWSDEPRAFLLSSLVAFWVLGDMVQILDVSVI